MVVTHTELKLLCGPFISKKSLNFKSIVGQMLPSYNCN